MKNVLNDSTSQNLRTTVGGRRNTDDAKIERSISVAAAVERATWGMGSTITTVATLWRTKVDAGALNIRSFAGMDVGGRWRVTLKGGG